MTAAQSHTSGSFDVATTLLAAGAEASASDNYGITALHRAAQNTNVELVRLLLDHDADPNAMDAAGSTPLHYAVSHHAQSLYSETDAMVRMLLSAGAKPDVAANYPKYHMKGDMPLLLAATHAPASVIQQLIDVGASVDFVDSAKRFPLGNALTNPDAFSALLAAGANLSPLLKSTGKPALLTAAENNNAPAIQALIGAGADSNHVYRSKTALHLAVAKSHPDAVAALLAAGANHLLPDKNGVTALDLARKRRRKAILPQLEVAEMVRQANNPSAVH